MENTICSILCATVIYFLHACMNEKHGTNVFVSDGCRYTSGAYLRRGWGGFNLSPEMSRKWVVILNKISEMYLWKLKRRCFSPLPCSYFGQNVWLRSYCYTHIMYEKMYTFFRQRLIIKFLMNMYNIHDVWKFPSNLFTSHNIIYLPIVVSKKYSTSATRESMNT